jgi:hypothetical protein
MNDWQTVREKPRNATLDVFIPSRRSIERGPGSSKLTRDWKETNPGGIYPAAAIKEASPE